MDSVNNAPNAEGSYSENSPFVRLLGTQGRVRILDVFLRKHYKELTAAEVADLAGVSPSTFHRNINELKDLSVVRETEPVAGTTRYKLNEDSPIAQTLGRAQSELLEYSRKVMNETESSELPNIEEVLSAQNRRSKKKTPPRSRRRNRDTITGEVEVPN
ncbi:winged helix-turn-helix domain-containing protein [Halorussus pelagicus]|uniref:winged helix-turn-helix domain-containing protein n=1 Tax=Halorussus pelagicus TaxID=2505977 RepID=UPI000FFC6630|nr:winged helix-turn-helix domain-containing protein [Halorussus pelagicus]